MILKILHNDRNSWWFYDNLEKIRCGSGGDFVLVYGVESDSSHGNTIYDYRVVHVGDMTKDEVNKMTYQWAKTNKTDVCADIAILNFEEFNEGVNYINWVLARKRDDEEKLIVFNTLGFLLNDEGKTIEKIAC